MKNLGKSDAFKKRNFVLKSKEKSNKDTKYGYDLFALGMYNIQRRRNEQN